MNSDRQRLQAPAAIPQLRAEIEALPRDNGGKRQGIPRELKVRILDAWQQSGRLCKDFAPEVSVSVSALTAWRLKLRRPKSAAAVVRGAKKPRLVKAEAQGFKRLAVLPEARPVASGFTIEGPNGLRISAVSAEELAKLWRALC